MEILWRGNSLYDGFGTSTYYYVKTLRELGIKVRFESLQGKTKEHEKLLKRNPRLTDEAWRVIHTSGGNNVNEILYTCYDAYKIPKELVQICNNSFELWTPSEFCKHSFWMSGVDRNIEVIPHGISPERFNPDRKPLLKTNKFTLLTEFAFDCPKENDNWLAFNFLEEFKGNDNIQLLCHTTEPSKKSLIQNLLVFYSLEEIKKKIKFHTKRLSFKDMGRFYCSGDAYVTAVAGEAFGLPILEASACGLPILSTYWGGQKEFLKDQAVWVDVERVNLEWSQLPVPDLRELRIALRTLYQNYEYLKSKALNYSKKIRKEWCWEEASKKIIKRLEFLEENRKWGK